MCPFGGLGLNMVIIQLRAPVDLVEDGRKWPETNVANCL